MALIGTIPQLTYGHNHWSTLFATAPGSPSTAGVPLPDGNRFVVELAVITATNIGGSPSPVWVDITTKVSSLAFLMGDVNMAPSRWPIEQSTFVVKDLTALLGDYVEPEAIFSGVSPGVGPCPGSFIRWGIVRGSTWVPMQSHIIESITERTSGRNRGWLIEAFGTALYFAGQKWYVNGGAWPGATTLNTIMSGVCSGSTVFGSGAPWPWAETFQARNTLFPSSWGVANMPNASSAAKLQLLHQVADSMGQRLFNTATGGLQSEDWTVTVPTSFRFSDEPTVAVDGHGLVPGTLFADLEFRRSVDRTAGAIEVPIIGAAVLNQTRYTMWEYRNGTTWPPSDLKSVPTSLEWANLAIAMATTFATETRLDRIGVDTTRDIGAWSLLTGATPLLPRCTATAERRRPGAAWFEVVVAVVGLSGAIDFTTGIGHARLEYLTRLYTPFVIGP